MKYIPTEKWEEIFEKYNIKNELLKGKKYHQIASLLKDVGYDITPDAIRMAYKRIYGVSPSKCKNIMPMTALKEILSESINKYGEECYIKIFSNRIKVYSFEGEVLEIIIFKDVEIVKEVI